MSQDLIRRALGGTGVVSWQVVQEFCNVALKTASRPMEAAALSAYLDDFLLPLCGLFPNKELFREAIAVQQQTKYSWYDSLIVTSALRLGCDTLYSEDLQHGRVVRGLRVVDPFREQKRTPANGRRP